MNSCQHGFVKNELSNCLNFLVQQVTDCMEREESVDIMPPEYSEVFKVGLRDIV